MSKAIVSVRKVFRPISEELRAYRIIAVISNKARWSRRHNRFVTSYHPEYRITESGDYTTANPPSLEEVGKFVDRLKEWHKISYIEYE